jgi:hypothetical protein
VGPGRKEDESGWILGAPRVGWVSKSVVISMRRCGNGEVGWRTGAVELEVFLEVGVA